jgi:hypothetical protein
LADVLSEAGKSRQINGIGMFVKVNCKERTQGSDPDFAHEMVFGSFLARTGRKRPCRARLAPPGVFVDDRA